MKKTKTTKTTKTKPVLVKPLKIVQSKIKDTPINRIVCDDVENFSSDDDKDDIDEYVRKKVIDSWEY